MSQFEAKWAETEGALDACVRQYGGASWESYRAQCMNQRANMLLAPPLPSGTMDACDFLKAVAEQEHLVSIWRAKAYARRCDMATVERAKEQISAEKPAVGEYSAYLLAELNGRMQALQKEYAQMQEGEAQQLTKLWLYATGQKVIDGRAFQAALSSLVREQLEVTLAHNTAIADRILQGGAAAAAVFNASGVKF